MIERTGLYNLKGILFSYYAIQAVLLPYLPSYFGDQGYSAVQIGWLMNIGPFMAMFAQPVWGIISDRYRTLKRIIILLWGLTIVSSLGLFFQNSFLAAFIFVLLLYFFMYPSVPLLDNLIVKSVSGSGRSYGSVRLWGSIGFCAVAFGSGYALESLGGIGSIKYLFWGLWVIPLFLIFRLRDTPSSNQRPVQLKDLTILYRNRRLLWFLVLVLIVSIPHRMNDVMFSLVLLDLGATEKGLGLAWFFAALGEIPTFALLARYFYRFNELSIMSLAALLYSVRWFAYGWVENPEVLIALQLTHSVTFAVFWIATIHYLVRLVPEEFGSTGQAVLSSIFLGLAGIVG
ncbi:MAG: transporter, partial [Paenibacillus sp.]|nr:transporter [Paenibacillus sp.]